MLTLGQAPTQLAALTASGNTYSTRQLTNLTAQAKLGSEAKLSEDWGQSKIIAIGKFF